MAASALAQEKVWIEKPAYDKAECRHFEKLAKPAQRHNQPLTNAGNGVWTNCNKPVLENFQNQANSNAVSKKSKKSKSPIKDTASTENSNEQNPSTDALLSKPEDSNKFKPKEAKEKKNKADKKHANKKEPEKLTKEQKKTEIPALTNKGEPQYSCPITPARGSLANEVAKARQHIKQSLQCVDSIAALSGTPNQEWVSRVGVLEKENLDLKNVVAELKTIVGRLEERVKVLEERPLGIDPMRFAVCPAKPPPPAPGKPAAKVDDDDDDVDLFGSDSEGEDDAAAKIREERLAAYAAKKSKKPVLIAKSNIILDVKPWDDETDMKAMEAEVRKIQTDGLLWGAAKLVPLAYGIHKLQISCVVEDDKVSIDWLTEQIEANEDFVQSVDIAAFNKV